MAIRSPELIFCSYSCARRDHMARLTLALPFSVSSALVTTSGAESARMPISVALWVGTRSVILSFSNEITNSSR